MTTLQRIPRTRVSEAVIDQLLALINAGDLKPGDKLPSEAELMQQTGAGRPSLRSALHTLEAMHIIEIRQGVGAFVCEMDLPILTEEPAVSKLFSQTSILEAIAVRRMLEPEIAAAAALTATDQDLQRLGAALGALADLKDSQAYPKEAHVAFHRCVAELTHNALLVRIEQFLLSLWEEGLQRAFDLAPGDRGDVSRLVEDHRLLYEAIAQRDPALARQRVLEHTSVTANRISLLERLQSRPPGRDG